MLISVMDNEKLTKFTLPDKVEETFLIKYRPADTKIEKDINIEAIDGRWYLKSNGSIDVAIDNKIVDKVELVEHEQYLLSVRGQQVYSILYCSPTNDITQKYDIPINGTITIGRDPRNSISFDNNLMAPNHATISKENNIWYIKSGNVEWARVYVNNICQKKIALHVGDVIFINGLRIIWMDTFIVVNNPQGKIILSNIFKPYALDNIDNTKVNSSIEEDSVPLYEDSEFFCHVPRLKTIFEDEVIDIDEPPTSQLTEEPPILFTLGASLMMIASSLMIATNIFNSLSSGKAFINVLPQFIMIIAMLTGVIILPIMSRKYQTKKKMERENLRQQKYTSYLQEKEAKINSLLKAKGQVLNDNYPNLNESVTTINNRTRRLWEKEIKDDDFLKIRLGLGNYPAEIVINAPKEKFTLDDDNLREKVYSIVDNSKILENVPITFSFSLNKISALIFEGYYNQQYINSLMLQIVAYHSPIDLKIVILTKEENISYWNYAKFLPHCFKDDKEMRFFASNIEEMKSISTYLEQEFSKRKALLTSNDNNIKKEDEFRNFAPYYLIITDDLYHAKNIQFIENFLKEEQNLGFSLLIIDESMRNIPAECDTFIDISDKLCCIFQKELSSQKQITFIPEYVSNINMDDISFKLANIPCESRDTLSLLPTSLSFLEMYNVGNIKQLNIMNRWKTSNPVITLEVPIGVHPNGELFKLNLHEKFHGPHGLIAGSTGSGKSEFIITFILSMAINYHPRDVQFVLIDYKGGGLAGAFENRETGIKIPHLAGTITNLDTNEMNRTLVSIQSELKRRQSKFNEARDKLSESTIDIYKYQKYYHEGLLDDAISHLFIICDEFAELKAQQPEFMQQLISISRIGRSLGVHLILATQKPSGVVNDQIWSNSRFKVCLKVQNRSDSMEMLKRPEAASIKETGRFYLQVGYDELFELGQSAWCGAKYIPMERIKKRQDESINFINNTGYVVKSINDIKKKEDSSIIGEQLTYIVKYLSEIATKEGYIPEQLWLNKIPEVIYVDSLKKKYHYKPTYYKLDSIIGEYDDPANQKQDVVKLNLTSNGNTVIFGMPATGKENLLATIIYSIASDHSVDEVNFYILDFGAETLRVFNHLPHVGDVIFIEEKEKVLKLFDIIENEIENRKELFADYGGTYTNYCSNSGKHIQSIIIIINAYENFQENYGKYDDVVNSFIREANKYGIYFIVSTSVVTSIRSRMLQNFNNRISMQLADPSDYRFILNAPKDLNPSHNFGRGVVRINDIGFEFQSAFITEHSKLNDTIKNIGNKLLDYYKKTAPKIPILPKVVLSSNLPATNSLAMVPIGLLKENVEPAYYDFIRNRFTIIGTNILDDKIPFIDALLKKIINIPNLTVKVIDAYHAYEPNIKDITLYNDKFDQVIDNIYKELETEEKNTNQTVYFILGIAQLKARLSKEFQAKYIAIFNSLQNFVNSFFIAMDSSLALKSIDYESWYRNNVSLTDGIWLSDGFSAQSIIKSTELSLDERKINYPELGFSIIRGKYYFIKYMLDEKAGESDE